MNPSYLTVQKICIYQSLKTRYKKIQENNLKIDTKTGRLRYRSVVKRAKVRQMKSTKMYALPAKNNPLYPMKATDVPICVAICFFMLWFKLALSSWLLPTLLEWDKHAKKKTGWTNYWNLLCKINLQFSGNYFCFFFFHFFHGHKNLHMKKNERRKNKNSFS